MKKLISLLLVLAMSFSVMSLPTFAEEAAEVISAEESVQEATLDKKIAEKFEKMQAFGLFSGYTEEMVLANAEVPRGDFAVIAADFRGGINENTTAADPFADVKLSDEYGPSVAYLKALGAVDGVTENNFHPERTVSLAETLKILADLMGYQISAVNQGGYYDGYVSAATQIGLYVNVPDKNALKLQDVINIVWSALDTETVMVAGMSDKELILTIDNENTSLSNFLSIYEVKGVVDATQYTALIGKTKADKGKAKVNGYSYLDPNGILTKYLGYEVEVYFEVTEDGYKVLYANPTSRVKEIVIPAKDLLTSHGQFGQFNIVYLNENGKIEKESLPANLNFIYNNEQIFNFTVADWAIDSGTVTLVSNNSGATYTTALVENYEAHVVSNKDTTANTVITKLGEEITIKAGGDPESVIWEYANVQGNGLLGLREWQVLSIQKSKSGNFMKVIVNDFYFEGTIESFETENSRTVVTIDGTEYPLYNGYVPGAHDLTPVLSKGKTAIFYPDAFGSIVLVEYGVAGAWKYGILYEIREFETDEVLRANIYGIDGLHYKFNINQRITIDGTPITNKRGSFLTKVQTALQKGQLFRYNGNNGQTGGSLVHNTPVAPIPPGSDYVYQAVRYQVSEDGILVGLDTTFKDPTREVGDSLRSFTTYPRADQAVTATQALGEAITNRLSYRQLGFRYGTGSNVTVVMNIPIADECTDKEKYSVGNPYDLGEQGALVNIIAFGTKLNDIKAMPLVVQFKAATSKNWMHQYLMVDTITKTLDENDEPVASVKVYFEDKNREYFSDDVNMFDGIGRGDIIRLNFGVDGKVIEVLHLYSAKEQRMVTSPRKLESEPGDTTPPPAREVGLPDGMNPAGVPVTFDPVTFELDPRDDWHYLYEYNNGGMGASPQIILTDLYTLFGGGGYYGISSIYHSNEGSGFTYKLARPGDIDFGGTDSILVSNNVNLTYYVYDAAEDTISRGATKLKPYDQYKNSCSRIFIVRIYGENQCAYVFNY